MKEALIYLAAITLAEFITVAFQPLGGIVLHIIILVVVVSRSALANRPANQHLLLSLALVPLVRIISLAMPLVNIPRVWWYPVIYLPLLVSAIVVMRVLGIKAKEVGLIPKLTSTQFAVASSGLVLGILEYLILSPEPMIDGLTWQNLLQMGLVFLLTTGVVEEFIFRGVMQKTAHDAFGWLGIIYVSLMFGVLHMGARQPMDIFSWIDVAFVFAVAVFFAWIVKRTGSLLGVILAHGITNILLYLVIPFFIL